MSINAFKMDGLGNDFVIIDVRDNKINLSEQQIIKICDRNFLGCDQLILIDKNNEADAQLIFYTLTEASQEPVVMEPGVLLI